MVNQWDMFGWISTRCWFGCGTWESLWGTKTSRSFSRFRVPSFKPSNLVNYTDSSQYLPSPIRNILVGGFKHFLCSIIYMDTPSHWLIFFRGVETTNQSPISSYFQVRIQPAEISLCPAQVCRSNGLWQQRQPERTWRVFTQNTAPYGAELFQFKTHSTAWIPPKGYQGLLFSSFHV
jgi:hypothetical protein